MGKILGEIIGLCFVLLTIITGCSIGGDAGNDAFLKEIVSAYPELEHHAYEIREVKRIVDGDTIVTSTGDKVRLIGINTPESVKPDSPVEFFAMEASRFSKQQLSEKKIYCFVDTSDTDKYGRLLRYLFIEGQTKMYNEILIQEGYANTMTVPPNVMYAKRFIAQERKARAQKKGLWGEADRPTAAEPDKLEAASPSCENPQIKGNKNSRNERIYHIPEGQYYDVTIAEEMFCTEQEAQATGFRKSKK